MRTFLSIVIVAVLSVSAASVAVAPEAGCSSAQKTAEGSAAACLGVDVTQGVQSSGGTIVGDIWSAAVTGGATLPALIAQLIATFGGPAVQCAAIVVDAILGVQVAPAAGSGSAVSLSAADALKQQGRSTLEAEMKKRGWPTK